ncbi:MAG: hypothetical protein WKG32_01150 [Gemmatimonadaceae bacterium]
MTLRAAVAAAVIATSIFFGRTVPAQRAQQQGGRLPRAALERRVQARFADVVRARVGVNETQMRQLTATNRKFEAERRLLIEREREVRVGLRAEVLAGASANDTLVSRLLDQLVSVQRERVALVEAEQRDLAMFLSPVQRARYLAVQDQIRRWMEEMRRERQQKERLPPRRDSMRQRPPP